MLFYVLALLRLTYMTIIFRRHLFAKSISIKIDLETSQLAQNTV